MTAGTLRLAEALGAPICGTNDSHYLEAGHARAHEALLCIQTGTTMSDPNRWKFSTEEFYLKSADEMRRGLPRAARGLPEHAGGGRALRPRHVVRQVPPAALPGPRRAHAWTPTSSIWRWRGSARATARRPPTRCSSGSATSWASSPPWASPATSWWSGTSSPSPAGRASRWGPGAAPRPARSSPTASASPTWTHPLRPPLRAILEPRADLDAGHGHRLRRRPPRRGHPLRPSSATARTGWPTSSPSAPWAPRR